jgi:hypothetical protein
LERPSVTSEKIPCFRAERVPTEAGTRTGGAPTACSAEGTRRTCQEPAAAATYTTTQTIPHRDVASSWLRADEPSAARQGQGGDGQ